MVTLGNIPPVVPQAIEYYIPSPTIVKKATSPARSSPQQTETSP